MKTKIMLDFFKGKNIFITGNTGFKGSWLSYWLHKLGAKVIGAGLKPEKNFILFKALKLKKLIKVQVKLLLATELAVFKTVIK